MKTLSIVIAAATLVLGTPTSARADACCHAKRGYSRPLRWSSGMHFVGISANQKIDGQGVALGGVGGHVRYRGHRIGGEFSFDIVGNEFLDGGVARLMVPLQASAMLYILPRGFLNLYLLGGVQVAFTAVSWDLPNLRDDQVFTQVGAQAGVGAELNLGRRFVLTSDVRFFGLVRADEGPAGSYYEGIDDQTIVPKKTAGAQVNLGMSFRF